MKPTGHLLQDTEAVLILKLSGILIKGDSGSRRFIVEKQTEKLRGKERKQKGTKMEGRAKPHQKGEKIYKV